jgi:PPM family protein phosphatase
VWTRAVGAGCQTARVLQLRTAAATHVGLVRSHNEDSAYVGARLVVVADGMGGAAAGELASTTAVHAAVEVVEGHDGALAPPRLLARAVEVAAQRIAALVADDRARSGMGTTFTALHTDGRQVALAHLGDSRAYLFRAPVLTQVTADHTLVQSMVDAGRMSPAQARRSAHRHIVMRSLGGGGSSEPDLVVLDLVAGDRLLLCSDGLSDLVDDDGLAPVVALPDAHAAVDLLVAAALDAGGTDNVTVVLVDVVETDGTLEADGTALLGAAAEAQPTG